MWEFGDDQTHSGKIKNDNLSGEVICLYFIVTYMCNYDYRLDMVGVVPSSRKSRALQTPENLNGLLLFFKQFSDHLSQSLLRCVSVYLRLSGD